MPPKQGEGSRTAEKERRILSALSAVEEDRISSIRKAARLYQVPIATLRKRLGGAHHHRECRQQHHELNQDEEDSLSQSVFSLIQQGAAPSLVQIREMANLLLTKGHTQPPCGVGPNWAIGFMNRHEELRKVYPTPLLQRNDHQHDKSGDVLTAAEWFDQVKTTAIQHEIAAEDIYNIDETGFAIGLLAATQVVTKSDMVERASLSQPDNRRWATSLECINSTGVTLPPCIVFKGRYHIECWYTEQELPDDWCIAVSPNGWATDEIRLWWLKNRFIPSTSRAGGRFRLLVFDQESYLTPQFHQTCKQNNIIPICPPASARIRLPLEAGCLPYLKRAYRRQAENLMRRGSKYIDKLDFLESFPEIRREAYRAENIKNGFSATGIAPLCPEKVQLRPSSQPRETTPPTIDPGPAEILRNNWFGKELSVLKPQLTAEAERLGLSSSAKKELKLFFKQAENTNNYTRDVLKEYDELLASIQENEERVQAEEEAEEAYQGS